MGGTWMHHGVSCQATLCLLLKSKSRHTYDIVISVVGLGIFMGLVEYHQTFHKLLHLATSCWQKCVSIPPSSIKIEHDTVLLWGQKCPLEIALLPEMLWCELIWAHLKQNPREEMKQRNSLVPQGSTRLSQHIHLQHLHFGCIYR